MTKYFIAYKWYKKSRFGTANGIFEIDGSIFKGDSLTALSEFISILNDLDKVVIINFIEDK